MASGLQIQDGDVTLISIVDALRSSWSADTAYDPTDWSPENPARGQCLVSSLVARDYVGGELTSFTVTGDGINETHHCNLLPGGMLLDTTESQYDHYEVIQIPKVTDTKGYASLHERYLADDYDRSRYEILQVRVEQLLGRGRNEHSNM